MNKRQRKKRRSKILKAMAALDEKIRKSVAARNDIQFYITVFQHRVMKSIQEEMFRAMMIPNDPKFFSGSISCMSSMRRFNESLLGHGTAGVRAATPVRYNDWTGDRASMTIIDDPM